MAGEMDNLDEISAAVQKGNNFFYLLHQSHRKVLHAISFLFQESNLLRLNGHEVKRREKATK